MTARQESGETQFKREAAERAAALVEDGMTVGLGTGSTARLFIDALVARVHAGLRIVGVPTSEATAVQARQGGMSLATLDERPSLDMVVDGADEVDPQLNLIKGLGGALLREKIVACSTARLLIMVDEHKLVARLGDHSPVPVEVVPFGWTRVDTALRALGARPVRRLTGGAPFITDGGHYILDCWFDQKPDLLPIAPAIKAITGVVEHGLFLHMPVQVLVGRAGGVQVLDRP